MSDYFSDASSSVDSRSRQSIKGDVRAVLKVYMNERDKKSISVCIVPEEFLGELLKRANKAGVGNPVPPKTFTTPQGLQDIIDSVKPQRAFRILKLLFSGDVPEITFDVPSHFSQLKVLRCVLKKHSGHLLVDGSSTYHGIRLDKWQAHRHKHHKLIVGHERGVRIALNDFITLPNWSQCRGNFTSTEKQELCGHFENLSRKSGWDEIKGAVASIMGIAVGSVKLVAGFNGTVGGVYLEYAFGLHALRLGMGGAKVAGICTMAGSAVALGVGVAAAVYFVPWEGLFAWLKRSFYWLWGKICELWRSFESWIKRLYSGWCGRGMVHTANRRPILH